MTVVQAGFSPGGNCDGENTAQVFTHFGLVRLAAPQCYWGPG